MVKLYERFPRSMSEDLQNRFKLLLEESSEEYIDFMSMFFAYLVIAEQEHNMSDRPLNLNEYPTLTALLESHKLVTANKLSWGMEDDQIVVSPAQVERLTWKDHFLGANEQFVTEKVDEMFLSDENGEPYLATLLTEDEALDPVFQQEVLDHFVSIMGGEPFFQTCVRGMQSLISDIHPRFVYAKGEPLARTAYEEAKNMIIKEDEDFAELGEVMLRVKKLWDLVSGSHFLKYGDSLPSSHIDMNVYQNSLLVVLNDLQSRGVTEEAIREITILGPERFTSDVMQTLYKFKFE